MKTIHFVVLLLALVLLAFARPALGKPYRWEALGPAIKDYQEIVDDGGWPMVDDSATLREGDQSPAVDALIERLRASGDLKRNPKAFDRKVVKAVKKFQRRHGLKVDGVVGPDTFSALNVAAARRVEQLKINQRRLQDAAIESDSYVLVNIPDFHMYYVEDGKSRLNMRVIVGRSAWDTPSMSDAIERVVFQPRWNIPVEIVAAELAPKVAENPNYLNEKNMTVVRGGFYSEDVVDPATIDWSAVTQGNFEYFVYQSAGPDNPLGQVKFVFPNSDDIYLHDTPDKHLFGRDNRAQSHGCIRLEEPQKLADALIKDKQEIRSARQSDNPVSVSLEPHVPVHLVYWTAWVDDDGDVQFRDDIYNRDRASS